MCVYYISQVSRATDSSDEWMISMFNKNTAKNVGVSLPPMQKNVEMMSEQIKDSYHGS